MLFTEPLYLLLLIPAVAGLVFSFRHVHGMVKGRKRFAFLLRFVVVACFIVALSGPEAKRPNRGIATVYLVDRSDSISDGDKLREQAWLNQAIARLGPDDEAAVVVFGADARLEAGFAGPRTLPPLGSVIRTTSTNIADAIRLGSALFPDGKGRRLVLLSDGNETQGDAGGAAEAVAVDKIPIDIVRLGDTGDRPEAAVLGIEAPSEAHARRPVELRVIVDSTVEQSARLVIDRDDVPVKTLGVRLDKGKNAIVVPDTIQSEGFHRYRATLEAAADTDPRNNTGLGFVSVRGAPKLLLLQNNLEDPTLAKSLKKAGIDVDLRGPGMLPSRVDQLQNYDAVVLNDFNADNFVPSQMEMLRSAAENSGVGLAMIGGQDSYLPGGYYGTPIADALPVDLNVRNREVQTAASIAIIGDVSGSMGMVEDGMPKVRIMAKAAEETVNMLGPQHRVGVAGSAEGVEWVAPMQTVGNKTAIIDQIRKLDLGGAGIFAHMSIVEGKKVLEAEHTRIRHLILMCDGSDTKAQEECFPLIAEMRAEHITTSTVAIGTGKDVPFLQKVAAIGGGRFFLADHAGKLPAIMTQDTAIVARSAIEEGAFIPRLVEGEDILRGFSGTPPLLGYDLTDTKPLARVGMWTGKHAPLLATWEYGLATTLAFTSDAHPKWAAHWVPWNGFSTFWGQAAQAIRRRTATNNYAVTVQGQAGKARVEIKANDALGNPLTLPSLDVRIGTPEGGHQNLTLSPSAPGDYVGDFDADAIGSYLVSVVEKDAQGKDRVETSGFAVPYPAELRSFRPNEALLERIRQTTSGRVLTSPLAALEPLKNPGTSISELWFLFLLIGVLLLPLDVAVRRLALPVREMVGALRTSIAASRVERARRREEAPLVPVHVARLQNAKKRAPTNVPPPTPVGDYPKPAAPTPEPAGAVPAEDIEREPGDSAAGRLLAAKRRRQGRD